MKGAMRILVTGRSGQVARCLADRAGRFPNLSLVFAEPPELDLSDEASIVSVVEREKPDLVINAAAYTAVDKAEDEPELAMAVNGTGPGVLARAAADINAPMLHISTDYVYSGELSEPYLEEAAVGPLGVYGKTKLAGELAVQDANADHTILRTAWVFSPYGGNFVKTMLRLAKDRDALNVVCDQFGNPTSAHDIATALLTIAEARRNGNETGKGEVYHFAGGVEASWSDFAIEVFRTSKSLGGPTAEVSAIPTEAYPTKATRPKNSRLNSDKILRDFNIDLNRNVMLDPTIVQTILNQS